MKSMRKRRRWWFAGLALALLAACVGVWKWSASRPFSFLSGSTVTAMIVTGDPVFQGEDFTITYTLTEPLQAVVRRAKEELGPRAGWTPVEGGLNQYHFMRGKQFVSIRHHMKPDPKTGMFSDAPGTTVVQVKNPLTRSDTLRNAIFRVFGV
jgi:hypothetical protein